MFRFVFYKSEKQRLEAFVKLYAIWNLKSKQKHKICQPFKLKLYLPDLCPLSYGESLKLLCRNYTTLIPHRIIKGKQRMLVLK